MELNLTINPTHTPIEFEPKISERMEGELTPLYMAPLVQKRFEDVFGKINLESAFLYFARRFGMENAAKDSASHKELARYYLTPKDKDIVVCAAFGGGNVSFSFHIKEEEYDRLLKDGYNTPLEDYYKSLYSFILEQNDYQEGYTNFQMYVDYTIMQFDTNKELDKENDELHNVFKDINCFEDYIVCFPKFMYGFESSLEYRDNEAYQSILAWITPREEEFQKKTRIIKPTFKHFENSPAMNDLHSYCFSILEDFLRPTYIRDVDYNIYGEFTVNNGDDDEDNEIELVEYYGSDEDE